MTSANIYLLKVNKRNTRKWCEIYPKVTIKTPDDYVDVQILAALVHTQ